MSNEKEQKATRDGYGAGLMQLGENDERVVVLTADLAESTRVLEFGKKYPDRFFEIGIAEQNMMGVAAGLALEGYIPFVSSYAVFSPGRSWDQLRVSVCYSKANVKVVGAHTGVSVGPDGGTHQALEDVAITRVLPNITVIVPCDYEETRKTVIAASMLEGPVYFRFTREKSPVLTELTTEFKIGKLNIMKDGRDLAIIGCGPILANALKAAEDIESFGISVMVVNCHTIKPIDKEGLIEIAKKCGKIVTIEEHQAAGGLGSAVAEVLSQNYPVPMEIMGIPDRFGESGETGELLKTMKLDTESIVERIKKFLQNDF